jgi:hypothetical protein
VEFGGEFGRQRGRGRGRHLWGGGGDGSECREAMEMTMEAFAQESKRKTGEATGWIVPAGNLIAVKEGSRRLHQREMHLPRTPPTSIYPDDTGVMNASCFKHKLYGTI